MATAKTAPPAHPAVKKLATKAPAKVAAVPKASATLKPIKTALNKTALAALLAEYAGHELKAAKAFLAALESIVLASIHKKGLGEFTLPGLMKISVIQVPAKKKRVGIDPFTKVEREFAAKPVSTRVKVRALKKLKDGAN
jgi:nucleoid DNA-binding protein